MSFAPKDIDYFLRYWYDDWSNVGLSSELRHRIRFHGDNSETTISLIDLDTRACDLWVFEMVSWCHENIGTINQDWSFTLKQSTFYFKTKEDALAFKLCWS